ncbi:hypothetical protein L3X39_06405 [Sabulilitoribacter multivorans]|uniref:Uncharacterized protein n=1 Tax=Flaviramulus multivorans TaxID=1304750 RepID=A0ABS9IHM6_9FLAO|nr:hypothetical protein [Flaviramulus multivorans]MCF7560266.1 hypothetical protein [Flaviramulus multivorans]
MVALLIPATVKFTHVFSHHEHKVCLGEKSTHIHEVDFDCEFHKFQVNKNFTFNSSYSAIYSPIEQSTEIVSQYFFLSEFQHLHFALRGPPTLI